MEKNILVTGGTGYIGIPLVKKLHKLGHNLTLLVRETSDISPFEELDGINYIVGDITNKEDIEKAADEKDVVYHLAAYVKIWAKDDSIYDKVNVEGAEKVCQVALDNDILLMYISSFAALGPNPPDLEGPADESCEHVDFFQNEYERTKYLGTQKVNEYIDKGLKAMIFYPGFVFGPGDFNFYGQMVCDVVSGDFMGCPGDGEAVFCMSYLDDVVDALVKALDREDLIGEDFFLGGKNIKFIDYINKVAELADQKKPRKFPMWAGVLYSKLCLFKAKITGKDPYITPDMIVGMNYDWAFSCEKAKEKLGYETTPFEEALKETVEWYENYINENN
jgi:nucleoside-diphosphate-sugar epimerase